MTPYASRIAKIIAHNLRFERHDRQWAQKDVAAKAKISVRQYQKLELAQANVTIDVLGALSQAFGITVDRWMKLSRVRTCHPPDRFLSFFSNAFLEEKMAVGVRTLEGSILYGNPAGRRLGLPGQGDEALDLFTVLPGPAAELLRCQLACEQKGLASTYTNFVADSNSGQPTFFRFYPTLVLPHSGSRAHFAALYIARPEFDSQLDYYQFCDRLLQLE